jgi:hypothetical protein
MKIKTNKRHSRVQWHRRSRGGIRRQRTCKKGGMFRIMGKIVGEKGPDRAEKAWQIAQKVKEGLTPKNIKKFNHAESHASFTDLLSPFRMSANNDAHRPHSYDPIAHDEAMHKTPIRAHRPSATDMPPNLPSRSKHADTPDAWAWAPTSQHPNPVVTKLFDD